MEVSSEEAEQTNHARSVLKRVGKEAEQPEAPSHVQASNSKDAKRSTKRAKLDEQEVVARVMKRRQEEEQLRGGAALVEKFWTDAGLKQS